jgi:hypothetical protein
MERIDVRASEIRVNSLYRGFGPITGYHLYIVYTDQKGKEHLYEGLPFDPKTGQTSAFSPSTLFLNPSGLLTRGYCTISQWERTRNQLNIVNILSVTALTGAKASEKHFCLEEQTLLFNGANIPYRITVGPNSNTYVRTILDRCDISAKNLNLQYLRLGGILQ